MSAVRYEQLHLDRAPGCPKGWSLNFSAGINIIHGPNGSGKSTTARALLAGLWNNSADRPQEELKALALRATFQRADQNWTVTLENSQAVHSLNGHPHTAPELPSYQVLGQRCMIALHDLFSLSDDQIALAILRDAAGGYDLEGAVKTLAYKADVSWRKTDTAALEQARSKERELRKNVSKLSEDQSRLPRLEEDLAKASEQAARHSTLERALEHRLASEAAALADAALERFDSRLARVRPDDYSAVQECEQEIAAKTTEQSAAERALAQAEKDLAASQLPTTGVPGATLAEVEERLSELERLQRELERFTQETNVAAENAAAASQKLCGGQVFEGLPEITLKELTLLSEQVRAWERLESERQQLENLIRQYGTSGSTSAVEDLAKAKWILVDWLSNSRKPTPVLLYGLILIAALLILGAVIGWLTGVPLALAALFPAILLFGLVHFARGNEPKVSAWPAQIPAPTAWAPEVVSTYLDEVVGKLAEAQTAKELASRVAGWQAQLQRVQAEAEQASERLGTTAQRAAVAVDPKNYDYFLDALTQWQAAQNKVRENQPLLKRVTSLVEAQLEQLGSTLQLYGFGRPADLCEAKAAAKTLAAKEAARANALAEKTRQTETLQKITAEIERRQRKLTEILTRIGVTDAETVRLLLEPYAEFQQAKTRVGELRLKKEEAHHFFQTHPELAENSNEELNALLQEANEARTKATEIAKEKFRIETDIQKAEEDANLTQAVAVAAEARHELVAKRHRKLASFAGHLLANHLRDSIGQYSMPAVFKRANELFSKFTHGEWELIAPGADGVFLAQNCRSTGHARTLEQLSAGTRAQLLLAVRTAFIETNEHEVKLPLFLDETLANSDDLKAKNIIEAVIELAKEGRQIFYFTAQNDEVEKWRSYLQNHRDVASQILDLEVARGSAATLAQVPRIEVPPRVAAPEPGDLSYAEYGLLLQVPPLDMRENVSSAHLWHVCLDTATLHRFLCDNFVYWGQLDQAHRAGWASYDLSGIAPHTKLLQRMAELWRHGRGQPLTREALVNGGISSTYINRVWTLALELKLDARALMNALTSNPDEQLPRMRNRDAILDGLGQYLAENGCLPQEQPYGFDEIRGHLLVSARELGLGPERVDEQLAKVI